MKEKQEIVQPIFSMYHDSLELASQWESERMEKLFVQMDEFLNAAVELGNNVGVAFDDEHEDLMREKIKGEMEKWL